MVREELVCLEDVYKTYDRDNWILQGINLCLKKGEIVKIIGGEGSGKTTLLKIILCSIYPERGRVSVMGVDTSSLKNYEHILLLRRYMGVFFENFRLFEYMSVLDNLLFINKMRDRKKMTFMPLIERFLSQLSLRDILKKKVMFLSPGEKARLSLAMIFSLDTPIILVDEPFRCLSPSSVEKVIDIMKGEFCKDKGILMFSSKDLPSLKGRVFFLNEGKLHEIHSQDPGQE